MLSDVCRRAREHKWSCAPNIHQLAALAAANLSANRECAAAVAESGLLPIVTEFCANSLTDDQVLAGHFLDAWLEYHPLVAGLISARASQLPLGLISDLVASLFELSRAVSTARVDVCQRRGAPDTGILHLRRGSRQALAFDFVV